MFWIMCACFEILCKYSEILKIRQTNKHKFFIKSRNLTFLSLFNRFLTIIDNEILPFDLQY